MKTHTQSFVNGTSKPLEIWVEMYPDQYILEPGETFEITYAEDPKWPGMGLHTCIGEYGPQIYLQEFETAIVRIDGLVVEPRNRV